MPSDLRRLTVVAKSGDERFHAGGTGLGFVLADFWRWSVSDLVSNATRGRLAEFIVARSLGIPTDSVRDEWGAFDLITPEGLKVEVKSAAFIQSWSQRELSKISFQTPKTREWNPDTNLQDQVSKRQADVYVFALLAHKDKSTIDPLNVKQWQFYVLATSVLDGRTRSQHSITLKTLETLSSEAVDYFGLPDSVRRTVEKEHEKAV
jgi:hypothetical protein